MKTSKGFFIGLLLFWPFVLFPSRTYAQLPVLEIIKAGVTKAIKAMDLKVQRMQNETIRLQNAQKVLENELSRLKLKEIAEWTEKQRAQYEQYFGELLQVKEAVISIGRIQGLLQRQSVLLRTYRKVWEQLRSHPRFSSSEIRQMEQVYAALLRSSAEQLQVLSLVLAPNTTRMGDADRLAFTSQVEENLEQVQRDLRRFHLQMVSIALQRAETEREATALLKLFGFPL